MDACTVLGAGHFVHEEMVLSFRILIVSLMCYSMRVRVAERSGRRDGTQRPGRESALHTQVRGRGRGSGLGSGDGRPETPECAEETSRRVHEPSHAFQLK